MDQMPREGEAMADGQRRVAYAHAGGTKRDWETVSSGGRSRVAAGAYRQGDLSHPARRWASAHCMGRRGW